MKTKIITYFFLALVLIIVSSCGGNQKEENEQLKKENVNEEKEQSSQDKNSFEGYAENMQKMAEQMMGGDSDTEPVPPVSFKILINYLPESISGLNRQKPEGESTTMGNFSHSTANVTFNDEEYTKSAEITINDFALISALYMPYKMMFNMKYEKETSDGYEKSLKIGDFPAFEKWNEENSDNELTVLVGDRFLVEVKTSGLGEGSAKSIAESMDLSGLAKEKAN